MAVVVAVEDILYEEDLLRNSFSLKYWLRYLDAKRKAPAASRNVLFERALKHLPGSFKLWRLYLRERREQLKGHSPVGSAYEQAVVVFERALIFMHKMPRIWIEYLEFLLELPRATHTRHAFDRALRSLPVTQHERIWPLYLRFVSRLGVTETAVRVYHRFLKFEPDGVEEYIDFLLSVGRVGEAASRLAQLLNREAFVSPRGETRHTTWLRLCRLLSEHPAEVSGKLRAEAIIRGGLREFSDEVGHIWVSLADFFIRQAQFERARDVYEEAVTTVMTVRDFSMVFDAYAQYEESIIAAAMEQLPALEAEAAAEGAGGEAAGRLAEAQADLDIRLARLERLTERRPELLSSVLLRQNPHSVKEWLRRVGLFKADPARCIHTYATAVKTVSPEHATHGKLSSLWIAFAGFYEKHGDVKNARAILRKAADVQFKTADELASIWLERAELELRCKAYPAALELLREATLPPPPSERSKKALESGPVRNSLYRVTRLWALYADLEESVGTVESVKACYEKMFALKVITPQLVLSLAAFLEEKGFFEQSFQAYERGVAAFSHPWSLELWRAYLAKFTARYGGSKLERTRDLFEQAVEKTPPEASAEFWRAYALFELEHGLARHAMAVFARACEAVAAPFKAELFRLHIAKASETFGVAKTRPIYERAIEALPDEGARLLCLEYAQLETKLGEAERARALYVHAAQMYDPKTEAKTWQEWNDFEVEHGNEDSFREMLRIKRAVKVQYAAVGAATVTDPAARGGGAGAGTGAAVGVAADGYIPSDSWRGIQRGYVFKKGPLGLGYYRDELAAHSQPLDLGNGDGAAAPPPPPPAAAAAAALEPDVEEPAPPARHAVQSEEEADAGEVSIKQKRVPDAVFGSAIGLGEKRGADEAPLGALERFKRAK